MGSAGERSSLLREAATTLYHFFTFYFLPFVLDFAAVWAGTKAVIAVEKRQPLRAANWGAIVNACVGTTLFILVFGDSLPAFCCGMVGAYIGDFCSVRDTIRRERLDT